jgi:hypothetical protein
MGEVIKIQINIVGLFDDIEEVNELEDVAKVFAIEERIIDITYDNTSTNVIQRKKINNRSNSYNKKFQVFTVRGLN